MADVSKTNGIPVVSTASPTPHDRHPSSPPAYKLTSSSSNRDSPNTTSSTGSDLSYGLVDADDGASLQDLIDSELALRISTDTIGPDPDPDSPPPPIVTRVELLDLKVGDDDSSSEKPECRRGDSADSDSGRVDVVSLSNGDGSDSPPAEIAEACLDSRSDGGDASPVAEACCPDSDLLGSDAAGEDFPPDSGQPPSSSSPPTSSPTRTDVNSAFIAAEQNHQQQLGDVTEADILFYNTFNQAQSNGDDGFLSSPDTFTEHKFNPFATIPSQDVDSPIFEAAEPPFPHADADASNAPDAAVVATNRDSSSCVVVGVDNRMSEELTRESSGDALTPQSPVAMQPHMLDIVIPEIGVTPPEPGTEYDEDEYYRNLEASREDPEIVQQEPEVIEYEPEIVSRDPEVIQYDPEVIQYDPEVIQYNPETTRQSPEVIQYEPEVIEYNPEVIQNEPEVIQNDPEVIEYDPETIQYDPEIIQSDPEAIQHDPESTQQAAEATRDDLEVSLSESEPANGEETKEDFDSWTKVSEVDFDRSDETAVVADEVEEDSVEISQSSTEEVVGDTSQASEPVEHDLCINSRGSDSESSEALSSGMEKKSTKKKKSEVSETITNATTKTKRNKKTKKEEKENISVIESTINTLTPSPTPLANEILLEDARDLLNVSVKELDARTIPTAPKITVTPKTPPVHKTTEKSAAPAKSLPSLDPARTSFPREPPTVPREPLPVPRESPTVPREPCTVPKEPTTVPKKSPTVPREPPTVPREPPTVPREPATVPKEPPTVPREPPTVPREPPTVPREPPTVPREPSTVPREPPTVPREPPTVPREPLTVLREPLTVPREPPTVPKEPPTVPTKSPTVPREPPTVPREPPTVPRESPTVMTLKTSLFPSLTPLELTCLGDASGDETGRMVTWKARSMGDLTVCLNAEANASLDRERPPVNTGVSVLSLAASYCDLVQLSDVRPVVFHRRCVLTPPPPQKSSFSKFDALSKKTVLHVRSGDASKAQKQFSQASSGEVSSNCKACGKQVFQMEQVKAERCVWHKNCFRCKECSKQLTVDIYSSHEGILYCKPHFKDLFKPKAVIEDDTPGSDKPDLGLEELSSLNVKSRFQAFEQKNEEENNLDRSLSTVNVKRSPSILSKLAKFQSKGMDIGVTDDSLNGVPLQDSTSSEEEEEEGEGEREVVRANRKHRERPVSFSKMEDIKGRWETGTALTREERREERKQEISTIRSRLFMGHQGKMKEAYQQAVSESTAAPAAPGKKDSIEVGSDRARSIKERFERGDVVNADAAADDEQKRMIDEDLVDAGYTKKSRSLFLEMDATAAKCAAPASAPASKPGAAIVRDESFRRPRESQAVNRQTSEDVVRCSDAVEDVQVETADVGNKFKFFETFKPTERERRAFRITPPREGQVKGVSPEREIYRDPTIVRADDRPEEQEVMRSQTASKMLSFFKHMEDAATKEELPTGPKPLKCFTPPPDCEIGRDSGSSEEESASESEEEDEEHNPDIIRSSDKVEDEFLKQSQSAAAVHAKALRAKFERWEEKEVERERAAADHSVDLSPDPDRSDTSSIDTTRSLRARFESMNGGDREAVKDKAARPKVNRFV